MEESESKAKWLEARKRGLGASDAATVLGLNPWKSAYSLAAERIGLVEPDNLDENEAVQMGIMLEEPVAQLYIKKTGRKLLDPGRYTIQQHPELPWMTATLDRLIVPNGQRGAGVLEIKTTGASHESEWEDGDSPLAYQVQVQHQIAVMGLTWGSLAVLIGGQKFRWLDIERNDAFIDYLISKEKSFWEMVQRGELPDVDGSYSTKEVLAKLFPRDTGQEITLPDEAKGWLFERNTLKAEIKARYSELDAVENKLKAALGPASMGTLPDGTAISYKTQHRASYVVAEQDFRVLREIKRRGI